MGIVEEAWAKWQRLHVYTSGRSALFSDAAKMLSILSNAYNEEEDARYSVYTLRNRSKLSPQLNDRILDVCGMNNYHE